MSISHLLYCPLDYSNTQIKGVYLFGEKGVGFLGSIF